MIFIDAYIKKGICYLIVLSPLLSIYKSPIETLDLLTFIVLFIFAFISCKILLKKEKKIYANFNNIFVYTIYIIVTTLISILFGYNDTDCLTSILRVGKQILYIATIILLINEFYFNINDALNILEKVSIFLSVYLIAQKIFHELFGVLLPFLFFEKFIRTEYIGYLSSYEYWANIFFRPSSFFLEPAHYFQYIIVYFIYLLFGKNMKYTDNIKAVILIIAILFSTSGQGIVMSFGVMMLFYYFNRNASNKNSLNLVLLLLGLFLIFNIVVNTEFIYKAIVRIYEGGLEGDNALVGRTYSYAIIKDMPIYTWLIGFGFGGKLEETYFSSIAYHLIYTGIIGVLLLTKVFLHLFIHGNRWRKILVCSLFSMNFFAALFTGPDLFYYLPFVIKLKCGVEKSEDSLRNSKL